MATSDILLSIGVNIQELRKISGIVQKELAMPMTKMPPEAKKNAEGLAKATKTVSMAQAEVAKSGKHAADAVTKGSATSKKATAQAASYRTTLAKLDEQEKSLKRTTTGVTSGRHKALAGLSVLQAKQNSGITLTQKENELYVKSSQEMARVSQRIKDTATARTEGERAAKKQAETTTKYRETLSRVNKEEKDIGKTTLPMVSSRYRTLSAMKAKGIKLTEKETAQLKKSSAQMGKISKDISEVGKSQRKGFASLIKWGLGWSTVYGIIRLVKSAIFDVIKTYMQLNDTMARVATVTRTVGEEHEAVMSRMRHAVLDYAATSRAEITDVAKTMYFLGSAGLTVNQQMVGFKHIMDLTIGTVGKTDEAAKLVAGAFNVFGRSIRNVSTDAERFKKIADILAFTYRNQQVELSDVASAFTLVGAAAGLLEIDFSVLVGTIGFLNTGMLKGCYSVDTEILTDKGWKYFKDLDKTETVATLNPKTHELEYQKPYEYVNEPYEGPMYKIKNRHLDLLVTPNHWIYSKLSTKKEYGIYKRRQAIEVFGKAQTFTRGAKWSGKNPSFFTLPSVEMHYGGFNHKSKEIKIQTSDWVKFLAWYLSEGCSSSTRRNDKTTNYKIKIYQSPGKKYNEIKELLLKLPFKFYENHKRPALIINSKVLFQYLKQFGKSYEKFIPKDIKDLSPKLLKIFIETYAKGDGRVKKGNIEITTSSIKMHFN